MGKIFYEKILFLIPFSIGGTVLLFTFLTFFDFFEPYIYPLHMAQGEARSVTQQTLVGPYPRETELIHLQTTLGITTIISLLDSKDLPQEKALFNKEKKLCAKYNLHLLSFPLSYLSLDNDKNKQTIYSLLKYIKEHPKEKFYIHCYLGKHRAGKVEELLKAQEGSKSGQPSFATAAVNKSRNLK